jgi:hypothetical protein
LGIVLIIVGVILDRDRLVEVPYDLGVACLTVVLLDVVLTRGLFLVGKKKRTIIYWLLFAPLLLFRFVGKTQVPFIRNVPLIYNRDGMYGTPTKFVSMADVQDFTEELIEAVREQFRPGDTDATPTIEEITAAVRETYLRRMADIADSQDSGDSPKTTSRRASG